MVDAPPQTEMLLGRRPPRAREPQRLLDPAGDEVERRPALDRLGSRLAMSEHEDRGVVRRVVAPPAVPRSRSQSPRSWPNMFRPMMNALAAVIWSTSARFSSGIVEHPGVQLGARSVAAVVTERAFLGLVEARPSTRRPKS